MPTDEGPGVGKILVVLVPFLLVGAPLVALVWSAANDLMEGRYRQAALVIPALVVLLIVLVLFGRSLQRLDRVTHGPRRRP
jgi:ABC-type enterobactin transport system permease subunit